MQKAVNWILVCCIAPLFFSTAINAQPFTESEVYTAHWPPYVNKEGEELGSASRIVKLIYQQMDLSPSWQDLDYYFSYQQIKKQKIKASFPYFKTSQREEDVLFSAPLMEVENGVFYSTGNGEIDLDVAALKDLKVGKVAGYSYGEKLAFLLENAKVFSSEVMALTALANGEVDLLPISVEVARNLIQEYFPHKVHEFKLVKEYSSNDAVHLIAPKSPEGERFLSAFDEALRELKNKGIINQVLSAPKLVEGSGYVRLVPTEGFPVVTGYELASDGNKQFYVIPQGSRAEVLSWDDVVLMPHKTEKIFDGMMNYSQVRIVDGPHAGRDLHVRNMHLEID